MELPPHLESALRQVYAAMRRYKPSANWADGLDVRPATDLQALVQSLDQIPLEVFNYYAHHGLSITTDREKKIAIRAFLPRLLRSYTRESLSLQHESVDVCFEQVGRDLKRYGMDSWPESESAPIVEFFAAWFVHLLQIDPGNWLGANRVLAVAACAGVPVKPLLHQWSNLPLLPATLHQAELLLENANSLAKDRDLKSWQNLWGEEGAVSAEGRNEMVQWLLSKTSLQRLEAAFFEANLERQSQLSLAAQIQRSLVS